MSAKAVKLVHAHIKKKVDKSSDPTSLPLETLGEGLPAQHIVTLYDFISTCWWS